MARRLARIGLIAVGLACAAVVLVVLVRGPLVEILVERALAAHGIAVAGVNVTAVGLHRAVVEDLRLGEAGEIVVGSLVARYAPSTLLRGRIESLALEAMRVRLDATGRRPVLGSLQPAIGDAGGAPPVPPVGVVTVSGTRVEIATELGTVHGELAGELSPRSGGGLTAQVDYAVEAEPGRLSGGMDLTRSAAGALAGTARIAEGAIAFAGVTFGGLGGEIAFAAGGPAGLRIDARLSSTRVAGPGESGGELSLEVDSEAGRLEAETTFRAAEGDWSARARATVEDLPGAARTQLVVDTQVEAGAGIIGGLGLPALERGSATATLQADAAVGHLFRGGLEWPIPRARLARMEADGRLSLAVRDLAHAERFEKVRARLELEARLEDGALTLELDRDAELHAGGFSEEWLAALGVPAHAARAFRRGAQASLAAIEPGAPILRLELAGAAPSFELRGGASVTTADEAQADVVARVRGTLATPMRVADLAVEDLSASIGDLALPGARLSRLGVEGSLAGEPRRLEGELELAVALRALESGPFSARRLDATLPVKVRLEPGVAEVEAGRGGRIDASGVVYAGKAGVEALRAVVESARLEGRLAEDGPASASHRIALAIEPFELTIPREGEDPAVVQAAAERLVLEGRLVRDAPYRPAVELAAARLGLPALGVAAERISGSFDAAAAERPLARLRIGALRSTAPSPRFATMRVRGEVERDGEALALIATARTTADVAVLDVRARHVPASGSGEATVSIGPLRFSSGGLQPHTLFAGLDRLRAVEGELEGSGRLVWQDGKREGSAALRGRGLSFDADEAEVRGLDLDLALDALFPPSSPPEQRLAVRRIDVGVPVRDVEVRFRIEGGEPPRLAIASARAGVSGGWLALRGVTFDPAEERQAFTIDVEKLELAEALAIVEVQGLSGTGELSGAIPVRVGGGSLAIDGGRLAATGPGVLRFESEQASRILSQGGEQVELLLEALEDFRYEELTIEIDKPAGGDATVALSILGANPDVLEGHPFRLNVNVEGRTGEVLAALAEIHGLSNRLLRRAWMFAR